MKNTAVFLDHQEARIFHVDDKGFDESTIRSPTHHMRRHPLGSEGFYKNHPEDEKRFFDGVARALDGGDEVLVLGPSTAKLQFLRYVHKHDSRLGERIVGVETVDHPTDRQIAAYVRRYFEGRQAKVAPAVSHSSSSP